ncbi:MAG: peptide-methionine (S)-S-oxide reductase [Flavobacteriaceae bacterium]|nr:peptide-methionine (S)-S-oxide reductase [Flavobacteriaceae bacterium]
MNNLAKIGFGGGCHWCAEAVFQSLKGVDQVDQGWIGSERENDTLSEAVIVHYDPNRIPLDILIEVHLLTHQSSSNHSMRKKYRSAIYYFDLNTKNRSEKTLDVFQEKYQKQFVTQVLPFKTFKASREEIQNYYKKNPEKPFCQTYIEPKLQLILKTHSVFKK